MQVATAKSIFSILYDELDKRFNEEISEECTDIGEIFDKKGMDGKNIKSIISCGLAIQIPTLDKLFADFGITSIRERRRYNSKYTQLKIDMYSNISLFVELKRTLMSFIETENSNGIDDMPGLLEAVYKKSIESEFVPAGYQDEHYLRMLIMILKKKIPQTEYFINEPIECPRCGMMFDQALRQRLEKTYLLESLHDDYTTISERQAKLERKFSNLQKKFDDKQNLLSGYEKSMVSDRESYNAYVKSKATNQLIEDYWGRIGYNNGEIDRFEKDNMNIKKLLTGYTEEKERVNNIYMGKLEKLLIGFDVPSDQFNENIEPVSSLVASGAYGPRCKVAQILAFIETQYQTAPDLITFSVVIDSPNVLEQDSEHLDIVIRSLLAWDKTDNQIIVSSIQGKDIAAEIGAVNIITLENPKNHLFSSDEYSMYEAEIAEIFTQF